MSTASPPYTRDAYDTDEDASRTPSPSQEDHEVSSTLKSPFLFDNRNLHVNSQTNSPVALNLSTASDKNPTVDSESLAKKIQSNLEELTSRKLYPPIPGLLPTSLLQLGVTEQDSIKNPFASLSLTQARALQYLTTHSASMFLAGYGEEARLFQNRLQNVLGEANGERCQAEDLSVKRKRVESGESSFREPLKRSSPGVDCLPVTVKKEVSE